MWVLGKPCFEVLAIDRISEFFWLKSGCGEWSGHLVLLTGVYVGMKMRLADSVGLAVVFLMLLGAANTVLRVYGDRRGTPVLLAHRCTHEQLMNRGDGREIIVRYGRDHSSFVNSELMPAEDDLRREIAGIMATRQEQVLFFAADEGLSYREVSKVLDDLRQDDPNLVIALMGRRDLKSDFGRDWFDEICLRL